jgi:hypothetical protein
LLATAPAAAARATTSCISSWVRPARSRRTSRRVSDLRTRGSSTNRIRITGVAREDCRIEKSILGKRTY